MSLMEKFADPALIDTLTSGEKATGALITTFVGMGITFVVLLLLWGTIGLMNKALTSTTASTVCLPINGKDANTTQLRSEDTEDVHADEQLAAVITAAIAAYEGARGGNRKLVVRKISRVRGQTSAWADAGNIDIIKTRKL